MENLEGYLVPNLDSLHTKQKWQDVFCSSSLIDLDRSPKESKNVVATHSEIGQDQQTSTLYRKKKAMNQKRANAVTSTSTPRAVTRIATVLLFLCLAIPALANTNNTKPNVILVMTDDQGYGDMGCLDDRSFC